jgi:predicted nucleic acid-binding protein
VSLVVDASVATKWVLPEPDADRAGILRAADFDLIAPALIVAEIGNAVWKRARKGELSASDAVHAVATARGIFDVLHPIEDLASRATEIAIMLNHPIYDCFYLALAEREKCAIITADERLLTVSAKLGAVEGRRL